MSTVQTLGLSTIAPLPLLPSQAALDPRCDCECGRFLEGNGVEELEGRTFIKGHVPPSWREHARLRKQERDARNEVLAREANHQRLVDEHNELQGMVSLTEANRVTLAACGINVNAHLADLQQSISVLDKKIDPNKYRAAATTEANNERVTELNLRGVALSHLRSRLTQKFGADEAKRRLQMLGEEFRACTLTIGRKQQILTADVV